MHIHLGLKHQQQRREREAQAAGITIPASTHSKYYLHILDRTTFVAGIVGPFAVIPQIYQIFSTHQAAGVSITSWFLMFVVTAPWILYGLAHKDKTIIVSFILWEVVNALVVIGALLYH